MTEDHEPARSFGVDGRPAGIRTLSLNSDEAHAALCGPRERPWILNGSLPSEPRSWNREVMIEPSIGGRR